MKNYFFIDEHGYLSYSQFFEEGQEPSGYVEFDESGRPGDFFRYNWNTKQWVDPRPDEIKWQIIKIKRNGLLLETDWTQLADIPQETKQKYEKYRQELRDITNQPVDNIVWPTKPE